MSFSPKSYVKVEILITGSDAFTLGVSKLGTDKLSATGKVWTDITDNVIRIQTTTGPSIVSGVYAQPQPGTLSLDMQSATLDPNFNARIRNGIDIRLTALTTPTNHTFWYGRTTAVYATYLHDGQNIINIQATDYLDQAMGKISTSSRAVETTLARFNTLMSTAGFASRSIAPITYAATMAALALDARSIGDMLTELVKCELGLVYWIADPFRTQSGYIVFDDRSSIQNVNLYTPDYQFSDIHSTAASHSCYSSIDIGADLDQMTNEITAIAQQSTGGTKITASNADQVALYGLQSLEIALDLYQPGGNSDTTPLTAWANVALARPITRTVKRIQTRAVGPTGVLQKHVKATVNETARVVKTIGANTIDTQLLISNVSHTIDSDGWLMDIQLWSGLS